MDDTFATIIYKSADGKMVCLEVSTAIKGLLEQSERQISSQNRQDRRRHTVYSDAIVDANTTLPHEDIADEIIRLERDKSLHTAIGKLSEVQRRRVHLHYFSGLTHRQIAELDGVAPSSVTDSIHQAIKKLKKLMNP
jgi:RNA polymerase sigma factor (sigma-70 family)